MSLEAPHSLLTRQLKRYFGPDYRMPEDWAGFVNAVNAAYHGFDRDREMLERSLELSSQELLQAGAEIRAVFRAIPDLLIRFDAHGAILNFKIGTADGEPMTPATADTKGRAAIAAAHAGPELRAAVLRVAEARQPATIEYALAGASLRYEARLVPALENEVVAFVRDITERRQLEQQFLQSQKMEAFGQLAGGVAHDFNNMLTVIIGNLSLIRLGELSAANQKTALDDCFYAAQRAANLTSQLLTFSRRQPIELRDLDLNDVVANLTKMLQRLIGEHIVLEKAYGAGAARVRADAGMMEQALMNLALNARDAMPDGGTLRIETAVVDLDVAALEKHGKGRPGRFVRMTVSDTGTGIPRENVPHIFEPFYTTKEVGKGTGLGLATVFGIVEQHAGWIEVESEPGAGTTMRVFLPAAPGGPDLPAAPAVIARPRRGTETILLAEDEAAVRTLMCKLLRNHGYLVHAAGNGGEALTLWRQHRGEVDLLITDMIMPGGVGGRELAAQLLADQPDLRVIYCSGYTDEALGADVPLRRAPNFLEKPFDVQEFLGRVRRCLDTPAMPAAPRGGAEL